MDKRMNRRKLRIPCNIELIEDYEDDNNSIENMISNIKPNFDGKAVIAAVQQVNGGLDLSNEHWEECWSKHLENKIKSEKETSQKFSLQNDIKAHCGKQSKISCNLNSDFVRHQHKLCRNAAIMGLVNTKIISLEDLLMPNNVNFDLHGATSNNAASNDKYKVGLIPLHEDPEIFIHPLRKGIDKKKFEDIDFTVTYVGKKTKVTPREYFLRETTDDFFNFVKKSRRMT